MVNASVIVCGFSVLQSVSNCVIVVRKAAARQILLYKFSVFSMN